MDVKAVEKSRYPDWDNFVEKSSQGTVFSTSKWLEVIDHDEPWVLQFYKGDEVCGGLVYFVSKENACHSGLGIPITPFQGMLTLIPEGMKSVSQQSLQNEIAKAVLLELGEFQNVYMTHHYSIKDVRPFLWEGYKSFPQYTYVVDLSDIDATWDNMEKDTRNMVGKAVKNGVEIVKSDDVKAFDKMYAKTFERKGLVRTASYSMIKRLFEKMEPDLFMAYFEGKPIAGVIMITDTKRAYYILGASEQNDMGASYLTLWRAMQEMSLKRKEIDLVGCNDQRIAMFKSGYGGKLELYLGVRKGV